MKSLSSFVLSFTICSLCYSICFAANQDSLTIDEFNKPPKNCYFGYAPEPTTTQEGYCVYYHNADVNLSRIQITHSDTGTNNMALGIRYALAPYFPWGNWLSIRREFESHMDLVEYSGLELSVKVEVPSGAQLRVTLSDIKTNGESGDEMWWIDCESFLLKNKSPLWLTIRLPFKDFYLSWGDGARYNDRKLNLSGIVGIEINLISKSKENINGVLLIDYIRGYN